MAVVGLIILFSNTKQFSGGILSEDDSSLTGSLLKSSKQDCISSSTRPCYDKQTGKKQISIQPQGGEKAFEACLKNAAPNDNGELTLSTLYCEQERFSYCFDGKSNVMLRKFEGKCDSGVIQTRNEACPDYQPVPYHQIYSSLEPNLEDLNTEYQSDFVSFLKAARNQHINRLMLSSTGVLFAAVSKYEYVDSYWTFVPYIYKSPDRGKTWTGIKLPTTASYQTFYQYVSGIAEDDKGNLYAGGRGGLWKSTDGGNSWNQIPIPTYDEWHQNLKPYAIRYLMTLKDGSLLVNVEFIGYSYPENTYRSFDGGNTWSKLFSLPVYSMVEADDGSLVVSDYSGDVYKFSNNGLTKVLSTFWEGITHPLLKARDGIIYFVTSENARYTQSFKYLWGYPIVSFKSEDNGNTWKRMDEVPDALGYGSGLIEGSDGSIYLGSQSRCWGGTVYRLNPHSKKWEVVSGSSPYLSNIYGSSYWIYTMIDIDGKILNSGNLGVIFVSP